MTSSPLRTVMVVEDDTTASASLLAALSRHGFDVVSVGNGRAALEQLEAGPAPDVILLDLVMPEMDGWQFLDRLRGTTAAAVPVIVTTGTGLTAEWVAARGGAGFLHKPFTMEDLVAELRRVLGSI
jgi:DNA-binding response OmpR family regulator